jgi:hypothetical protein
MSDYDTDVLVWSERQSALLRRRAAGELVNEAELDWHNIAEEIESVGRSELHAVESLLFQALLHRLKAEAWQESPRCRELAGRSPRLHRPSPPPLRSVDAAETGCAEPLRRCAGSDAGGDGWCGSGHGAARMPGHSGWVAGTGLGRTRMRHDHTR